MGLCLRRRRTRIVTAVSERLGAFALSAPFLLSDSPAAFAQEPGSDVLTADIPAEPLASALSAFASQTGLRFVYVSGVLRNQKSHAVSVPDPQEHRVAV